MTGTVVDFQRERNLPTMFFAQAARLGNKPFLWGTGDVGVGALMLGCRCKGFGVRILVLGCRCVGTGVRVSVLGSVCGL